MIVVILPVRGEDNPDASGREVRLHLDRSLAHVPIKSDEQSAIFGGQMRDPVSIFSTMAV
jgi:hypothetical protein